WTIFRRRSREKFRSTRFASSRLRRAGCSRRLGWRRRSARRARTWFILPSQRAREEWDTQHFVVVVDWANEISQSQCRNHGHFGIRWSLPCSLGFRNNGANTTGRVAAGRLGVDPEEGPCSSVAGWGKGHPDVQGGAGAGWSCTQEAGGGRANAGGPLRDRLSQCGQPLPSCAACLLSQC